MIKQLIGQLVQKASAKTMKDSPSPTSPNVEGGRNVALEALMKKLREQKEKDGSLTTSGAKAKVALLELIMPEICTPAAAAPGFMSIDKSKTKEWASACGEMVGILAGLAVRERSMGGAIDEVASNAKQISKVVHEWLVGLAKQQGVDISDKVDSPLPNPNTSSAKVVAESKAEAAIEAKRKIIDDLEVQAMLESDAAVKVAFTNQVERMKKELELLVGEQKVA